MKENRYFLVDLFKKYACYFIKVGTLIGTRHKERLFNGFEHGI